MSVANLPAERNRTPSPKLTPHSAARLSAGMLLIAGAYAAVVTIVALIVRYSPICQHIPGPAIYPLQIVLFAHAIAATISLLAARQVRRTSKTATMLPKILVALMPLGFIGSVDLIVGIFYPPSIGLNSLYERHIERGWTNRPNAYTNNQLAWMRFDNDGLRIHEDLSDPDPQGRRRILFVGDSVTLGYNLPARKSFAWWTPHILNERHPGLDVATLNGGTCGYDMAQELNWYEEKGRTFDYELVIWQFCMNDVTKQFDPTQQPSRRKHAEIVLAEPPSSWSGIRRAIFDIQRRMKYGDDLQAAARKIEHAELGEVIRPNPPERIQRAWKYLLEDLERVRTAVAAQDKPLLFVIFPIFQQLDNLADPGRPQQKLCEFAKSKGMHYLDLLPFYRQEIAAGATPEELFGDETHPTALGQRVAAKAIADYIEQHNLLPNLAATTQTAN